MLQKILDYLIGLIIIGLLIYLTWYGYNQIQHSYPTSVLQLSGQLDYIDSKKLENSLAETLRSNLWNIDVEQVKAKVYQDPWVNSVFVAKVWPNILQINIVTHQVLAKWNNDSFLTLSGKVLKSTKEQNNKFGFLQLPNFYGKAGEEDLILKAYLLLLEQLSPLNLLVDSVAITADDGINVRLSNRTVLKLGTFDLPGRITRFIRAYRKKLHANLSDIVYVDLRYTNGVAVCWGNVSGNSKNIERFKDKMNEGINAGASG